MDMPLAIHDSGRRGFVAQAQGALHDHAVEPSAVLEPDGLKSADESETGALVQLDRGQPMQDVVGVYLLDRGQVIFAGVSNERPRFRIGLIQWS